MLKAAQIYFEVLIHYILISGLLTLKFIQAGPAQSKMLPQAMRNTKVKVKVRITLRMAVYLQSVRLGVKPLETHGQKFFKTEPLL
jgi:hypothetical protein